MVEQLKVRSISKAKAEGLAEAERQEAIVTGVLVDVEKPEFTAEYARLLEAV
jgi:hypothetical protein